MPKQKMTNEPEGLVPVEEGELKVLVKATKTRVAYGRREYLFTPVAGSGNKWMYGRKVRWLEEPEFDGKVVEK